MNGVFDMKIFLVYKWALKAALADLKPTVSVRRRPQRAISFFNIACVCALIQRDVWRTTSWWFRFKPPWAVTVNSSSGRIMPNMNSSGTPWWVSCIPKVTFLWLPRFSTHPPQSHVDTAAHTHTQRVREGERNWGSKGFSSFDVFEMQRQICC